MSRETHRPVPTVILVSLGSNLAWRGLPPASICRAAFDRLRGLVPLAAARLSSFYATRPIPLSDQPDYVNAAACLVLDGAAPALDPATLLRGLQDIEAAFGRTRSAPNAARTLDLDLVAWDGLLRAAPDPVLPHPRCHLRRFVLEPLAEIAPDWRHPRLGLTARSLAERLPDQGVVPLAGQAP